MGLRPVHSRCRSQSRAVSCSGARHTRLRLHCRCADCPHDQNTSGHIHFRSIRDTCFDESVVIFERQDPRKVPVSLCRCDRYRVDFSKFIYSPDIHPVRIFDSSIKTRGHLSAHRCIGNIVTSSGSTLCARDSEDINSSLVTLGAQRFSLLGCCLGDRLKDCYSMERKVFS